MLRSLASLLVVCAAVGCADSEQEMADPAPVCTGKCDGASSSLTCAEKTPPAGQYKLANPSTTMSRLFQSWLASARQVDHWIDSYLASTGRPIEIEKVIKSDPDQTIFQATIVSDRPSASDQGRPTLHSWVVFYDGAEFHWLQGRYNFPVKNSHLIDSSAFVPHSYGYSLRHWKLVSENGELIQEEVTDAATFRRVSNDAVLLIARGQSSGWNDVHYVVHDDAITFLPDEEEPCAGFNSDPWRTF